MPPSALLAVIAALEASPVTFFEVVEELYRRRYTGNLTIAFLSGVPQVVTLPPTTDPVQIRLKQIPKT